MICGDSMENQMLRSFLDEVVDKINRIDFIENDPISIPHSFSTKQDIEISGFFSAILSWGTRKTIIQKSLELMSLMDNSPYDFIRHHQPQDLKAFLDFKHRTFQTTDLLYFIHALHQHYCKYDSLEQAFLPFSENKFEASDALTHFYRYFFSFDDAPVRTKKHIASPEKKSTCKRLNMYLRWMVRSDDRKVDFGLWKSIPASSLMIPLDVHVENYARQLNLLFRKQRDWAAVEELTANLRKFNAEDPVIYDYALFGLGVLKHKLPAFAIRQ